MSPPCEPSWPITSSGAFRAITRWPDARAAGAAGWLFVGGTLLFSGSLYLMTLTGQRWLGAVTPFGGLLLIAGWACLAWVGWKG